ncbi:MAG: DUF4215 domain-containing protein [Polyangiaceae bacterium]
MRTRLFASTIFAAAFVACGNPEITTHPTSSSTTGAGGNTSSTSDSTTSTGANTFATGSSSSGMGGQGGMPPGPACGDGKIDPGEKCDDGNGNSGDGCTGTCDAIEQDFACPNPGMPCVSTVVCGDAKISGNETCDDQNNVPGDGCDASCHVELGWSCIVVGAACVPAMCGDGTRVGNEACDDGNPMSGDGCSSTCKLEPGFKCDTPGMPCTATVCGDGVKEGTEQCDDGNHDMGDGCSPNCVSEPTCAVAGGACTSTCGDGIKLPNGSEECEDGNTNNGDGCSSTCTIEPGYECTNQTANPTQLVLPIVLRDFKPPHPDFETFLGSELGIVSTMLGADQKPVHASMNGTATTSSKASFDQWYRDVPGTNLTILQSLTLTKQMSGAFQYANGSFFPLDNLGFGNYANSGHNFHFTSEVRYWFQYNGTEVFTFTGDDDVWVFINKKLAIDLGGVHGAATKTVTLSSIAASHGLTVGQIYEIVVWQAERHTVASSYTLTLGNFVNGVSSCHSVCGDGIKTPDEACDDGVNDGTYGHCTMSCGFGPHCGDGLVDPTEECDDGVNLSPYGGCAPGCKFGGSCGDGVVQSAFGEQCDDGTNDGGYGECAPTCKLGERCGDGVVQAAHEECDDGNKINTDSCANDCTSNIAQ